jgi:hypothetical protein
MRAVQFHITPGYGDRERCKSRPPQGNIRHNLRPGYEKYKEWLE